MSREFDVVIIGAGVIGAVAAGLLVARGLCAAARVAIVAEHLPGESRSPEGSRAEEDWDLRVFALSRASELVLKDCGVWDRLPPARVFGFERMCVWDASGVAGGSGSLTFDCADIGEPNLGSIVDGRVLQTHCLNAARAAGIVVIEAAAQAVAMTGAQVCLELRDGRTLRGGLLVAADGADSITRGLLGIETAGHVYVQDALVAHVRTRESHRNTAWQRFLATGPLAFLPLPDGRVSIVWSTTRAEAARLRRLDPREFGIALTAASGAVLGDCELVTPIASFPLQLRYALDYLRPRAVLLGDAAHVVHPLAGQGLNLGLADAAALAQVLGEGGRAGEFGDMRLLRRYERWRKSENLLAAAALDGLERLFSNTNPALTALRTAGLSGVGRLPFLKNYFARRALGLSGDVPSMPAVWKT
jgi:2-octaprenylphenol hydroxylase